MLFICEVWGICNGVEVWEELGLSNIGLKLCRFIAFTGNFRHIVLFNSLTLTKIDPTIEVRTSQTWYSLVKHEYNQHNLYNLAGHQHTNGSVDFDARGV